MARQLSIVIPAFNEEATIADVVKRCLEVPDKNLFDTSIFVVDDGSSDRTAELAESAGAEVLSHHANYGVGRAFHTGLERSLEAGSELIVNIDGDGQFDPAMIPTLIEPILEGRSDFATASRFKDPELVPDMPFIKLWGNRQMSRLISMIARRKFYDVSCGFRAYSREAALRLNLWGEFTYTQESILDLTVKGMRIEEVPMKIRGSREFGKSKVASNLFNYGFRSFKIILHTYRDFWPSYFFGWLSLVFVLPGGGLMLFLLTHYLRKGSFTPHIWSGFTGAGLMVIGLLIAASGFVGETLKRIRLNQEMLLYYERRSLYSKKD